MRLAGFIGATCASVALVATAVETTGAYFTSSKDGNITAQGGHLTLSNTSSMNLNFQDMMPGANQTKPVNYAVSVSPGNTVDLWLTFDTTSRAYNFFTGGKYATGGGLDANTCVNHDTTANCGGLGRYGYFAVAANDTGANPVFQSGNLSFADSTNTPHVGASTSSECGVNADGDGGSSQVASSPSDHAVPYCGVPGAILVAANLGNAASGSVSVTFGIASIAGNNDQNASILPASPLPYHLVATQHGQRP
ncbi:hypothetical protein M6B22_16065 [Jatrophihabitans cynanchi]|uniref:Uncharacterized protein n=1 Tax=Jatrophihabitans cynanchi TaxID=2944128 RepID=A0ABY7JXK3_9ACTN|nr:hypothetical protein [Jatrophihabitans sp. SB3-54]WAX56042.1 hypothetical protein M6B22_16065 [Jatrophihabitans sp. SB3-54]